MNGQENYIVEVNEINKVFIINGRVIRSPFRATISLKELQHFLFMVRSNSVINYSISVNEHKSDPTVYDRKFLNENELKDLESKSLEITNEIIKKIESENL